MANLISMFMATEPLKPGRPPGDSGHEKKLELRKMKTFYHKNAGKITVVYGVSFASGQGEDVPLHLYRVGNRLHRIDASGTMPLGEVEVGEYEGQLMGWGIDDPITIDGIVVSAAAIKSIGA